MGPTPLNAKWERAFPFVVELRHVVLAAPASGGLCSLGLLAARLAKNHPLPDGNKRAAWLAMIEFIERNGYELDQPKPAEAVDAMLRLASSELTEAAFVEWLRPRLIKTD